jgi:hypothetical protein
VRAGGTSVVTATSNGYYARGATTGC